jgi:hypothetical protein
MRKISSTYNRRHGAPHPAKAGTARMVLGITNFEAIPAFAAIALALVAITFQQS